MDESKLTVVPGVLVLVAVLSNSGVLGLTGLALIPLASKVPDPL